MSLINQMLQELDARPGSTTSARDLHREIRPIAPAPVRNRAGWLFALLALVGAVAVGYVGWQHFFGARSAPSPNMPPELSLKISAALLAVDLQADAPVPSTAEQPSPGSAIPVAPAAAAPSAADTTGPPVMAPSEKQRAGIATGIDAKMASSLPLSTVPPPALTPATPARPDRMAQTPPVAASTSRADEPQQASIRSPRPDETLRPPATPRQQADEAYKHGLVLQGQGRAPDALAAFERAIQLDPGHVPARQSLATRLLEARKPDEARQRLEEGLALDRASGTLAMMLARIELDQGDTTAAIQTLARTLPYDRERADHHAFMAGLLQKENRHREAIDYYLNALRKSPRNGVWWMGIGISLQAENRNGEARDAFLRAQASGGMPADLAAFVNQRLEQLR